MPKMDEYYYLSNKRYRALIVNFDTLSSYGEGSALYCLTDFQAAWLLSMTEYMRWKNRWEDCPCTEEDLDAMASELEFNLMNCFDTSWLGQSQYIFDQMQNEQLADFNERYDLGGLAELNPDTPTDFYTGDDTPNRVNALCFACDTYVRTIINAWAENLRRSQTALDFSTFAVSFVPYVGRIAAVVLKALAIAVQVAVNAANDDTAIEDVVCCMFNTLDGAAVNQANFENSLDGCGFDPGSNAAILRDIIAADLDNFSNWLTFMDTLGKCWQYLQAGVDYACPCAPITTWNHTFDFTVDNGGFTRITAGIGSGTAGLWTAGVGWVATNTFYPSSTYRRIVYLQRTFAARVITKIRITFNLTKGTWSNPAEFIIADRATGLPSQDITFAASVNGNDQVIELNGSANISSFSLRHLSSLNNVNAYSGSAVITQVYIEGEGTDPF